MIVHPRLSTAALLTVALAGGCRKHAVESAQPSASSRPPPQPLDRLAPGELPPGEEQLFGLQIPKGMVVQGRFKDTGLAYGHVDAENVANYVRTRVDVERVEIGAARTIFPAVRIKNGAPDRTYRVEVLRDGVGTRLIVQDLTPAPPPPKVEGLSDSERWKRAGFGPDGKPLNMKALE
jgi:hypothetical protein